MPTKYTRDGFRDRAHGSQRFAGDHRPFRVRGAGRGRNPGSLILLTAPVAVVLLLLGNMFASRLAPERATAEVLRKEIRDDAGREARFIVVRPRVDKTADEASASDELMVEATPEVWDALTPGDTIEIEWRMGSGKAPAILVETTGVESQSKEEADVLE